MSQRDRTLVLGGSGVAGTGIVQALVEAGLPVDILDLRAPESTRTTSAARFIEADVREPGVLASVADYGQIVVAFGLLARGISEQPAAAWSLNLQASLRMIEAARTGHCRRLVFLSSAMVYDRAGRSGALAERAPLLGRCLYTHSKLAVEHALACAVQAGLGPTLVLRPFTIFGPGPLRGEAGHLVGRWLELARAGEALSLHGDGSQTVDLVPSAVLGAACVRFLSEPEPPPLRVLNGSCGQPMTIRALAELFVERFPSVELRSIPTPANTIPASQTWGDPQALQAYLGPDTPLPDPVVAMRSFLARG